MKLGTKKHDENVLILQSKEQSIHDRREKEPDPSRVGTSAAFGVFPNATPCT